MNKWLSILTILICSNSWAQQTTLFSFSKKGKWGYMDQAGKIVLAPTYDYAEEFQNGLAVVAVRNQPCVIDTKGQRVIDTGLFQYIGRFSEGLAAVTEYGGAKFYINTKGKKVITLSDEIYEARIFSEGIAVVSKKIDEHETKYGRDISTLGYKFAYMNTKGEMITDFMFDDADELTNGLARVKQGIKFGLINAKGEFVVKPAYNNIGMFSEHKACVDENGKYGYINEQGEMVIKAKFDYAYDFSEGLAGVWVDKKYGFMDSTGTVVIPAVYDQIKPFAEGKAAVLKDGKWGFIDRKGTLVLRHVFDNASVFSEGKCAVLVKRLWGYIDHTGALVIPADFDAVGAFHKGVADVVYRDVNLYVNPQGQLLPLSDKK